MSKTMVRKARSNIVTPCAICPLRPLTTFRNFTPEELRFVEAFKIGERELAAGETILAEGDESTELYTLLSGWAFKHKTLDDGRRQIVNYALPGDLLGLQGAVFDRMMHTVEALTDVVLCRFAKDKLWTLFERHPGLGYDVTWIAAQEKSILAEFLVSVGQRSATERVAFLLLSLFRRARDVGLAERGSIRMPVTQEQIADTIGFSLVHTNKTIGKLRRSGAFEWNGDRFTLVDEARLVALAGDPVLLPKARPFI